MSFCCIIEDGIKVVLIVMLGCIAFKVAMAWRRQRELEAMGVKFAPNFPIISDIFRMRHYSSEHPHAINVAKMVEDRGGAIPDAAGIMLYG